MAWKERDKQKRRLESIVTNLDGNLRVLKDFEDTYRPAHPLLADFAVNIATLMIKIQEAIQQLNNSI